MRRPRTPAHRRHPRLLLGLSVAGVVIAGCGTSEGDASGAGAGTAAATFGHIHSLDVNPADGTLHVASHHGVFALGTDGFDRVGEVRFDAMSFTVAGPDHFLMSGHPEPGSDAPPHLGLVESRDAGQTWTSTSLEGEVDLHALAAAGGRIYGVDSQTGRLMGSTDGEQWRELGQLPAADVAVDPDDPDRLLLTDGSGALVRLEVSGQPAQVDAAPPVVLLDWLSDDLLVGVGPEGTVHRSDDAGTSWQEVSTLPGAPHALTVTREQWYAATEDGVVVSEDAGATWTDVAPE
jgi:hypothetical protein